MKSVDCSRIRRGLPFYLEGELEPLDSLETASHLSSCGECVEEAHAGGKVLTSLRDLPEPEPTRDIAGNVLGALRMLRGSLATATALKWSSLGLLMAVFLWPALNPRTTFDLGIRLMSRLGEMINAEAVVGGLLGMLPSLVRSPERLMDLAREGLPTSGATPSFALLVVLPLLLLAAAVVFTFLSGGLVFSASRSPRLAAVFRRNR